MKSGLRGCSLVGLAASDDIFDDLRMTKKSICNGHIVDTLKIRIIYLLII